MTQPLNVAEVATRYQVSEKTVLRRVANGEFPKPIKLGRKPVWPLAQLIAWEAGQAGLEVHVASRVDGLAIGTPEHAPTLPYTG